MGEHGHSRMEHSKGSFRTSRFYLNGEWVPPAHFPLLRRVSLWLADFAPEGPTVRGYCWLDVAGPVVDKLGCLRHGHFWIIDGNGPPPACRWCRQPQPPEGALVKGTAK
jgi:hypothetical protein